MNTDQFVYRCVAEPQSLSQCEPVELLTDGADCREIAIMIEPFGAVRLWLNRSAERQRIIVEDLDTGDYIDFSTHDLVEFVMQKGTKRS